MLNLQTYFELFMCTILQILNLSRTVKFKLYIPVPFNIQLEYWE